MRKLIVIGMLACASALAQQPEIVRKVIDIRYADLIQVEHLIALFEATSTRVGNGVAIRGTKDAVEAAELAIRKIDVPHPPARNVELTVYLISASGKADAASPMPSELEPVAKQLRNLFAYKAYGLIDSFVLRMRPGVGSSTSGTVRRLDGNPLKYNFRIQELNLGGEKDVTVRINKLYLATESGGSIETDLDMREGQKVVVGKASLNDTALILVLSGKVVD